MYVHDPIPEPDWKVFREVRPLALERFCEQALSELQSIVSESVLTYHDRYLKVFRHFEKQDRTIAALFDDYRRSTAKRQLAKIVAAGWLTDEEISRFSEEARDKIHPSLSTFFDAGDRKSKTADQ